jgi:pimeloyl-ACP methyl ester carboxylesterase
MLGMSARQRFPAPGRFVDVDGRLVHVVEGGTGDVAVVFESGMGGNVLDWTTVLDELPPGVRTVAYDRAGLGWSDPPRIERSPTVIVDELEAVLAAVGAPGPYVLVAHSLGARYVRLFTQRHPRDVAGLVLVDGYHETWDSAIGSQALASFIAARVRMWQGVSLLSRLGIVRLLGSRGAAIFGPDLRGLPTNDRARFAAMLSQPDSLRTAGDELRRAADSNDVLASQTYGDMPLRAITHSVPFPDAEQERAWQESQAEMATHSSVGEVIRAEDAGHYVMVARPSLVVEQIGVVVADYAARVARLA